MNGSASVYDNFDPTGLVSGIASAAGNIVGGITGMFSAKAEAKGAADVAKAQAAGDATKAFYDSLKAGEQRAMSIGATNQALIGGFAQRQQSKADAKKAEQQKWMYIGIAAAVAVAFLVGGYFYLNKKKAA